MQRTMPQKNFLSSPPAWVADSIVYQIFPDRFRLSNQLKGRHGLALKQWGSDPKEQGFQGGDLFGVIEALDYLQEMGITCLYLNPIFSSAANHRYHTYDYLKVDPILGGNDAFDLLLKSLHDRDMRLVLDGVFNHCGRGFWPFHHLLENGIDSPYRDWFHIYKWPLNPYPLPDQKCGYKCWWDDPALPQLNHNHQPVREYLLSVARYWIKKGIDGWRLDVPDEVPLDFWIDFRQAVKLINPDAWILGEIWGDARPWLKEGHFDGVMNYRIGWSSLSWCADCQLKTSYSNPSYPIDDLDGEKYIEILKTTLGWYPPEVNRAQLNLLDSHDVPRSLDTLKGDSSALKLALTLLFLQPGAPCIYYGTEIGLSGGAEPLCREAFPWNKEEWPVDLTAFVKSLASLRKGSAEFLRLGLAWSVVEKHGLKGRGFVSSKEQKKSSKSLLVVINRSRSVWLKVDEKVDEKIWLLGSFEKQGSLLGPQSVIVSRGLDEVNTLKSFE